MPAVPAGATRELGSAIDPYSHSLFGNLLASFEETPELRFPNSVIVFDRMRRTDPQIAGVLRAICLPIRSATWRLHGNDVRPEVMDLCRQELGLYPPERGRKARIRGVVWSDFLRHALLHIPLGFMAFEQVYEVGRPGPGLERLGNREVAHIRKLAPRLPRLVSRIDVARDGGLEGIRQIVRKADDAAGWATEEVKISKDRLVFLVHEQEGGDWYGNSILRPSYKPWFIKDGLERLAPMIVERNGMGVPIATYDDPAFKRAALQASRQLRAGETSGLAVPEGVRIAIEGVKGSTKDELPLIKWFAEQIGINALLMFLNLGHDAGARSLGDTFVAYFLMSLNAAAGYIGEIVTEHVLRDLVVINFGEGETYPVLRADEIEPKQPSTSEALKDLVETGVIIPDAELETFERRRRGWPVPPGLPTEPVSSPVDRIEDVPTMPNDDPEVPAAPPPELEPVDDPTSPAPETPATAGDYSPDDLKRLVDAAAVLIRSGFAPDAALEAVGLNPIEHLGLLPVTVQPPDEPVAGLSEGKTPTPRQVAWALDRAGATAARRRRTRHADTRRATTESLERRLGVLHRKIAAQKAAAAAASRPRE